MTSMEYLQEAKRGQDMCNQAQQLKGWWRSKVLVSKKLISSITFIGKPNIVPNYKATGPSGYGVKTTSTGGAASTGASGSR